MNKHIKRAALVLALAGTLTLSGCGGDNVGSGTGISVVREETGAEYRLTAVKRGNITLTESVRTKYFAARQENHGFAASGLYYDQFMVSVGDDVKAGDILATLDCVELDAKIAQKQAAIEELDLNLERNIQLLALFDERQGDRPLTADDGARRRGYETAIRDAEDEKAIVSAELSDLLAQREGRVIYAAIDGTVTFVRDVQPGETSVSGRVVVTVTDLTACAFTASVQHPESLSADEIYTITIDGEPYDLMLTTAEELGIEPEPMNDKSTLTRVYFEPLTPTVNLSADATGSFVVTVASNDEAIYIPADALTSVNGVTCVYVENDAGLMSVREVTVGIQTSRYVEITSGLEEGENVIMY